MTTNIRSASRNLLGSHPVAQPLSGVWLPIATPFIDGEIDTDSYRRLLNSYLDTGINGIIPLGTTGESPSICDDEIEALVDLTVEIVDGRFPIYVGVGGNSTNQVIRTLRRLERYRFDGILSICPYYNRPSEDGICRHFVTIAQSTDRKILIYNIPYRTGVNLANDAVLSLSETLNIVGIKDCCGNMAQSIDLLRRKPSGFSVMTGEDALYFTMLALGADGGILASAHYRPDVFVDVFRHMMANDHQGARAIWSTIEQLVRRFFKEPNPMPIKHWLWRQGVIASPECRLPMTQISPGLAAEIEAQRQYPDEATAH